MSESRLRKPLTDLARRRVEERTCPATLMAPPANKHLADAERKLTFLLQEIRQQPEFERVKLYVARMTGGKLLSTYLPDESIPIKERAMVATTLVEILLTKAYDRLPEIAPIENGNAAPLPAKSEVPVVALRPGAAPCDDAEEISPALREQIRAEIRAEVRRELADVLQTIAKVLKG